MRQRDGIKLLRLEDVISLVAEQKYTTVHHTGGEDLIDDSLRTLETEFGERFLRIHRSALVNRSFIEAVGRTNRGLVVAVRAPGTAPTGPVAVTIEPVASKTIRGGEIVSALSALGLFGLLAWPIGQRFRGRATGVMSA